MFKKAILLALLATAMFATPVSNFTTDPFPSCLPCPKG